MPGGVRYGPTVGRGESEFWFKVQTTSLMDHYVPSLNSEGLDEVPFNSEARDKSMCGQLALVL